MNPRPDDELDETRLQALFDETAELPGGPTLTKLGARAREIPVQARRRPWWYSLRIAAPATGMALAGALAVLMLPGPDRDNLAPPAPIPVAQANGITPSTTSATPPSVSEPSEDEADTQIAFGFAETDDGLSSSIAPEAIESESEAELDAFLVATSDLVDEGG